MGKGNRLKWTMDDLKNKGIHVNGDNAKKLEIVPEKKKKPVYSDDLVIPKEFEDAWFIPFNVPSSKNSRRNFVKHKNDVIQRDSKGKMKSISLGSQLVEDYKIKTKSYWEKLAPVFKLKIAIGDIPKPYEIKFLFVRDSNRKADFHNLVQLPMDLMQEYGWIEDDDMKTALPYPPDGDVKYLVHKKGGVFIKLRRKNKPEIK